MGDGIFHGHKLIVFKAAQCSGRELLYLVWEIEMDETNLCTIPLSILVSWQTNLD